MVSTTRLLFLLAAVLASGGCASATAPPVASDVYYLQSIDGRPLPTSPTAPPNANGQTILADELVLDHLGTATRSRTLPGSNPSTTQRFTVRYAYVLTDGVLTLGNVICPPDFVCLEHTPEQGRIDQNTRTLTLTTIGQAAPVLMYHIWMPD